MDKVTAQWYDDNAKDYSDRTKSFGLFPGLESDLYKFSSLIPVGSVVADLGSGAGRDAKFMAEFGHTVIAVDVSLRLLQMCAKNASSDRVLTVNSTLESLPLADASVDGIWACGSLLHLSETEIVETLQHCRRILRRNSPLSLSMKLGVGSERRQDGRLFTYVDTGSLATMLRSAGLDLTQMSGPSRKNWILATAYKR